MENNRQHLLPEKFQSESDAKQKNTRNAKKIKISNSYSAKAIQVKNNTLLMDLVEVSKLNNV